MAAWRARAFHLTRNRVFLGKAAALILAASALVAATVHFLRPEEDRVSSNSLYEPEYSSFRILVHEGIRRLDYLSGPKPERLISWIRETAEQWVEENEVPQSDFDPVTLRLAGAELLPVIVKHTTDNLQRDAVAAYVKIRFLPEGDIRTRSLEILDHLATPSAPAHVHEMMGDILDMLGRREEALSAYMKDVHVPEASHARQSAFHLALKLKDRDLIIQLCKDKRILSEIDPAELWLAAKLTGDRPLVLRSLWEGHKERWMQGSVALALVAAAMWYIILIHTTSRESFRWWRYLPAVLAGIVSVGLLNWWQATLNYDQDPENAPSLTHEMVQWVMGVGLPEELAKLILFSFFLPVLLHHRSGIKAALTAGCVGLGFALEENLLYFRSSGPQVAIGRLLTANFIHLSLTGILGWHLYELFRTRFHHATEFLLAFLVIVVGHGFYDFALGFGSYGGDWGVNILSTIILALCARSYLHMLHNERATPRGGLAISRTAIFVFGICILGGTLMVALVWELGSLEGITLTLKQMLIMAPVALIYVREWQEV